MSYHSKSGVVLCRIRLFPTIISKMDWVLPLTEFGPFYQDRAKDFFYENE